ncbi:MAG: PAS domain S-box protein [Nitrospinae bacterium]|nr:PAS domain S-box protein [Nitrospinota bacterium]
MEKPHEYPSPLRLLVIITLSIFATETVLMLIIRLLVVSETAEVFIDASLLTVLLFPLFYYLFYVPFRQAITDLQRSESALRASEKRLTTIMKTVGDGIIAIGPDSGIRFVNKELCDIFGYPEEELTGREVQMLMPEKYRALHSNGMERYLSSGQSNVMGHWVELEGLRKGGASFPIEINIRETILEDNEDKFFTAAVRDITHSKKLEEERESLIAELNQTNTELKDFVYVVSHDLKTPLRGIHNYSDFLREDLEGKLEEEQKKYLDGLSRAVCQAEEFINDLLDLSRVSRLEMVFKKINIGAFLKQVVESMNLPPDVKVIMKNDWPDMPAEPTLLRQIFLNLISNAVKFNRSPAKLLELGWNAKGDGFYELFVHDNGIGIEPRFFEKILKPFQRLHTAKEFEGTGIGLGIVVKAASRLNGSIRIESKPGEGSTFFVALPKEQKGEIK